MYCKNCGELISDNANYCPICGVSQVNKTTKIQIDEQNKWNLPNRIALISLIVAIIAAIAALIVVPQVQQGLDSVLNTINPPRLPQEAKNVVDEYLRSLPYVFTQDDFNYSIAASELGKSSNIFGAADDTWCILINGITDQYNTPVRYWVARRSGIRWGGGPMGTDSEGREWFRRYNCSIG